MFVIYLILLLLILGICIYFCKKELWELGICLFLILFWMPIVGIISLTFIGTGEEILTGYVYSVEDSFDKTIAHIRFSKNAGTDKQPSICVKKENPVSDHLKELSGSDTKIKVRIPAGFAIAMWYGQCPIEAEILEEK